MIFKTYKDGVLSEDKFTDDSLKSLSKIKTSQKLQALEDKKKKLQDAFNKASKEDKEYLALKITKVGMEISDFKKKSLTEGVNSISTITKLSIKQIESLRKAGIAVPSSILSKKLKSILKSIPAADRDETLTNLYYSL